MDRTDSLHLLNETHDFPCPFLIKVIGHAGLLVVDHVTEAIERIQTQERPYSSRTRPSANGKYLAISIEPHVDSAEVVLEIYDELRHVEGVVMVM